MGDFFCGFAGSDAINYALYPRKDYQLEWLRMYLDMVAILKGQDPINVVTDDIVKDLFLEANTFALVCVYV